jgi:DNA-binding IclR family transcriptional regulator
MENAQSIDSLADAPESDDADGKGGRVPAGSQTLLRGLDVLEAVVAGPVSLSDLAGGLGLTRSTTHRLANALIERRYLAVAPGRGYQLGPKLLELGFLAQQQIDLVQVARPRLEQLAERTEDTVHLGVRDGKRALYLDKIPGRRRIAISSRVGDRHPLTATGLGKALLIDEDEAAWQQLFTGDQSGGAVPIDWSVWLERMGRYVTDGRAYDLEENEDQIRCVAAPIRDVRGAIVGALSVSGAAQYMDDGRMEALTRDVVDTARQVSRDLGWNGTRPT